MYLHNKRIIKPCLFLIILVFIINFFLVDSAVERVNCRRVVFHPYCRGISAKRSSMQLQESSKLPTNLEDLRQSLPKIWQGLLFPDLKNRIVDQFQRQQTLFRPMTAIIIEEDKHHPKELEHEKYILMENGNDETVGDKQVPPPYMMNIPVITRKRQAREQQNNNDINENTKQLFQFRMVTNPEFMQLFEPILQ